MATEACLSTDVSCHLQLCIHLVTYQKIMLQGMATSFLRPKLFRILIFLTFIGQSSSSSSSSCLSLPTSETIGGMFQDTEM